MRWQCSQPLWLEDTSIFCPRKRSFTMFTGLKWNKYSEFNLWLWHNTIKYIWWVFQNYLVKIKHQNFYINENWIHQYIIYKFAMRFVHLSCSSSKLCNMNQYTQYMQKIFRYQNWGQMDHILSTPVKCIDTKSKLFNFINELRIIHKGIIKLN